jgi:hypothetical protein
MKQRLRTSNRLSLRMRNRLRQSAVVFTFGILLSSIYFLYQFIGNVSEIRAQQLKERNHPQAGILEGFSGRKKILIHPEKLPINQKFQNFPLLVSLRLDELKSSANGGFVSGRNAEDIIFTSTDGLEILPFQIERYNPETGKLTAWVSFKTLSKPENECFLYYGKSDAVLQSSKATFDKTFRTVWHLNGDFQTAGSLYIPGEFKGTTDEEGRFGSAKKFQTIEKGMAVFEPNEALNFSGDISVSAWIKNDGSAYDQTIISNRSFHGGGFSLWIDTDNKAVFEIADSKGKLVSLRKCLLGTQLEKGKWYQLTGVYSKKKDSLLLYVNGKLDRSEKSEIEYNPGKHIFLGVGPDRKSSFMNGIIDEIRIASKAFSAEEIQLFYDSENDPESFFSVDGNEVFSASPSLTQFGMVDLKESSGQVIMKWQTLHESNLDYFILERSIDGIHFQQVAQKLAAGKSDETLNYFLIDPAPLYGESSYRIRARSFKGESCVTSIHNIHFNEHEASLGIRYVSPNPFKENFSVSYRSQSAIDVNVKVTSISGLVVYSGVMQPKIDRDNHFQYKEAASLRPGIYILSLSQGDEQKTLKIVKQL